jgi:hypothetical protein
MATTLTQEYLKEILHYDSETGWFTRIRKTNRNQPIGQRAGTMCRGYRHIKINNKVYGEHRLAWLYVKGSLSENEIDHINMVRDDNRWCNLREATHSQNQANSIYVNKSGFKGACMVGNKWRADIRKNGQRYYLGLFDSAELAHARYCQAAQQFHGDYARFN